MLVPSRASEGGARAPARSVGALLRASVEARAARRLCVALSAAAIGAEQRGDACREGFRRVPSCKTFIRRVRGATARCPAAVLRRHAPLKRLARRAARWHLRQRRARRGRF
jgi:hypothetical protein